MPSPVWLFVCAYLIVAVGTLLDFRPAAPGLIAYGIIALLFAAGRPPYLLRSLR